MISLQVGQVLLAILLAFLVGIRILQIVGLARRHTRRLRERRARSEGIVSPAHPNVRVYRF